MAEADRVVVAEANRVAVAEADRSAVAEVVILVVGADLAAEKGQGRLEVEPR